MHRVDPESQLKSAIAAVSRRSFLQTFAAASLLPCACLAQSSSAAQPTAPAFNADHGRIKPPVPVPAVPLLRYDGKKTTLAALTQAHATAVQLMFTTCTTTCPIQAAIFQRVQALLPAMSVNRIQLLSISVNPDDDNPAALSSWRNRFSAGPQWIAAAPAPADNQLIQAFFGQARGSYADHSTQVNIIDRQGRLFWRTTELPTSQEIAAILAHV
jgi:protein SCO1/2